MSEAVLRSCPFCGGEATVDDRGLPPLESFRPSCMGLVNDRCPGIDSDIWFETPEEAIAAWNKRPTEDALIQGLETAHGQSHIWEPDSYALEMVRMSIETCLENLGIVSEKIRPLTHENAAPAEAGAGATKRTLDE